MKYGRIILISLSLVDPHQLSGPREAVQAGLQRGNFSPAFPTVLPPRARSILELFGDHGETEHVEVLAAAAPCHGVIGKTVAGVALMCSTTPSLTKTAPS